MLFLSLFYKKILCGLRGWSGELARLGAGELLAGDALLDLFCAGCYRETEGFVVIPFTGGSGGTACEC